MLGPAVTAIFSKPVSVLEVEMNFPEICGDINYELIYVSGPTGNDFSPTLDQNVPSVTAESTDNDQMGVYRYTLRA